MNKLTYKVKNAKSASMIDAFLVLETKETLFEVASDLGIYCPTALRKDEIIDNIKRSMYPKNFKFSLTGGVNAAQSQAISQVNSRAASEEYRDMFR